MGCKLLRPPCDDDWSDDGLMYAHFQCERCALSVPLGFVAAAAADVRDVRRLSIKPKPARLVVVCGSVVQSIIIFSA